MHITKWLFVLLFAFSCTALAQPMRVTSQLSGDFLDPDTIVLGQLGFEFVYFTADSAPFVLPLSAVIDPANPETNGTGGQVGTRASSVSVALIVGDQIAHFNNLDASVS